MYEAMQIHTLCSVNNNKGLVDQRSASPFKNGKCTPYEVHYTSHLREPLTLTLKLPKCTKGVPEVVELGDEEEKTEPPSGKETAPLYRPGSTRPSSREVAPLSEQGAALPNGPKAAPPSGQKAAPLGGPRAAPLSAQRAAIPSSQTPAPPSGKRVTPQSDQRTAPPSGLRAALPKRRAALPPPNARLGALLMITPLLTPSLSLSPWRRGTQL
jgi:hypothetical protein